VRRRRTAVAGAAQSDQVNLRWVSSPTRRS
jgi:hypothetical protein